MAKVIFTPNKVDIFNNGRELLLVIERDKEQELVLCCGTYLPDNFYVDDQQLQQELDHGYARVIGWGDLDECYKEARELQGM